MSLVSYVKRIKRFCVYLVFPGFLLFSSNVFAKAIEFRNLFTISEKDTSVNLLRQIFGNVGNVLTYVAPLGKEVIFQVMFREFNQAVLALVVIVVLYTMLAGILATAHEGQFLGKAFHSMWVPVRTVAGFALLIPTKTGYSIIQIFFMWVVLQGIGAADQLWNSVVDYLQSGGSIVAPVASKGSLTGRLGNGETAEFFTMALLCMHQHAKMQEQYGVTVFPSYSVEKGKYRVYRFPKKSIGVGGISSEDPEGCGKAVWDMPGETKTPRKGGLEMISALVNAKRKGLDDGVQMSYPALSQAMWEYIHHGSEAARPERQNPLAIFQAAVNANVVKEVREVMKEEVGEGEFWKEAEQYGWANAGAYFYTIASLNSKSDDAVKYDDEVHTAHVPKFKRGGGEERFMNKLLTDQVVSITPRGRLPSVGGSRGGSAFGIANVVLMGILGTVFPVFGVMITATFAAAKGIQSAAGMTAGDAKFWANTDTHPIVKLQQLGSTLVGACTMMYTVMITLGMLATVAAYLCTSVQPAWGLMQFINTFVLIPLMALVGVLMGAGLSMAIYLPLVPYIIFTFMVIGWLIAVIETLIGAPLVAMGLTFPEGDHMIFGRAQKSMQLIMNVFARPMLMIFGLISAIILSFVAINFASEMFGRVVVNVIGSDFAVKMNPFYQISYIVIYFGLVITIINRCFSLIHIFPDKILSWIGWQAQFGEYKMGEDKVEAKFEKGAGMAIKGAADYEKAGGWKTGRGWQKGLGEEEAAAVDARLRAKPGWKKVLGFGLGTLDKGGKPIKGGDKNIQAEAEASAREIEERRALKVGLDVEAQKKIDEAEEKKGT